MPFRVFQYPLPTPPDLPDLNAFLAAQRIAVVRHKIVNTAGGALLVFVVEITASSGPAKSASTSTGPKIDYREVLNDEQFAVFSRLRTVRKEIADGEGIPVYAIFSNAQLAEMVQRRLTTVEELAGMAGIGKARVEKYAPRFTPLLVDAFGAKQDTPP
jgi:superfamily II DNA helicase RecQ